MNVRTRLTVSVTVIAALQAGGLALAFETAAPLDASTPAAVCTSAAELPSGHDNLVDINSAPKDWLVWVGIEEPLADKIIVSRPYQTRGDLVSRGLLTPATYDKIKDRIIARRA